MAYRNRKSPPSTRMYRQFAIITVALTVFLAVMADGRDAAAVTHMADRPAQPVTSVRLANPEQRQADSGWGTAAGPSQLELDARRTIVRSGPMSGDSTLSAAGYGPDYLSQFTPEQRAGLAEAAATNIADVETRPSSLEAASRARSGSAGRE